MKYKVTGSVVVDIEIEIDNAEDEDDAIDQAYEFANLQSYVGNNGIGDKLIGTEHSNVCLSPCDGFCESIGFEIEAKLIGDSEDG